MPTASPPSNRPAVVFKGPVGTVRGGLIGDMVPCVLPLCPNDNPLLTKANRWSLNVTPKRRIFSQPMPARKLQSPHPSGDSVPQRGASVFLESVQMKLVQPKLQPIRGPWTPIGGPDWCYIAPHGVRYFLMVTN